MHQTLLCIQQPDTLVNANHFTEFTECLKLGRVIIVREVDLSSDETFKYDRGTEKRVYCPKENTQLFPAGKTSLSRYAQVKIGEYK